MRVAGSLSLQITDGDHNLRVSASLYRNQHQNSGDQEASKTSMHAHGLLETVPVVNCPREPLAASTGPCAIISTRENSGVRFLHDATRFVLGRLLRVNFRKS